MEALFGPELQNQAGETVSTSTALAGLDAILIYFSASWCPPCRQFTPILTTFWNKHHSSKKFNVVFVSSDKDAASQKEYFSHMGSGAYTLPFGSSLKNKLSSKYKVQGIPTLVAVDGSGNLITTEARDKLMADPNAESFPWKALNFWQTMDKYAPSGLKNKDGSALSLDALKSKDYLMLYFSASWCPPCQRFTPELVKWYENQMKEGGKGKTAGTSFELVYVPSDRDEASYESYYAKMPWATTTLGNRALKQALSTTFGIQGIPALILVKTSDGSVVTDNAREKVSSDPGNFPWPPQPVETLEAATNKINDVPTLVMFTDDATDESSIRLAKAVLDKVAAEYFHEGKPSDNIRFAVADEGDDAIDTVRSFLGKSYMKHVNAPDAIRITIVDIQGQRRADFKAGATGVPDETELRDFVADFLNASATCVPIKS